MKHIYITFSGAQYDATTKLIVENAPQLGADEVRVYDDLWLMKQEFYRINQWLWNTKDMRGFGWFCWKPFVILHELLRCEPGDVILYTDADTYPIADLKVLYDWAARLFPVMGMPADGVMLFAAQGCSNKQWVKDDCWTVMAADQPYNGRTVVLHNSQHATARFMLFQAGLWKPMQLLIEWLTYCLNPLATTFEPSRLEEALESRDFQEHRTEQAILSLLAHKYGYHLYREADAFGNAELEQNGTDSWYPQVFVQDGRKGEADLTRGSAYRNV